MQGVGQFTRVGMAAKSGGILTECVESNRRVESVKIMSVAGHQIGTESLKQVIGSSDKGR